MNKLPRSQMRSFAARHLKVVQQNLCPLCGKFIDINIKGEAVIDHDHDTGEIRGILHRSCNSAEGKIANAAGKWGAKSMKYTDIVPFLKRVVTYLEQPGVGLIYPLHKTPEEKKELLNKRARTRRADAKARAVIKGRAA